MYLKSIEIYGFKSFANKIIFKFNNGITGIVGPNGSGKSNVGDAVRWVLGEQSAKQLRGSKMEDVIFSGTELRKPQGSAYVAITLDNSDHSLPIDYNEVTVARRVYRSGESEYLINGVVSRLKDVNSLFFDTGIGKEGYSIIGQGQIERILSGKPEERRELFDEAAGIVKYKKNKAATEKSLENERANLSRVKDILGELEKQVGPLKEQSETARKYHIHACTDVTGFSFLGHLHEMMESGVSCHIWADQIPVFPGAVEAAEEFLITAAGQRNRNHLEQHVTFKDIPFGMQEVLFDPQTSGGLLMAVDAVDAEKMQRKLLEQGIPAAIVGKITEPAGTEIYVTQSRKW